MTLFSIFMLTVANQELPVVFAATPVPWFFIIAGIITVILAGLVIWAIVRAAKRRKENEKSVHDGR